MSRRLWFLILFASAPWALCCFGQTSCLPALAALQTVETVDPTKSTNFIYHLQSERNGTAFVSKVILQARSEDGDPHRLNLAVLFDPDFKGVSLPYNLYAVLVLLDGEVIGWWDYTRSCGGPGISFFPGREIDLPAVKLIGDKPQKLQIMVWGRL